MWRRNLAILGVLLGLMSCTLTQSDHYPEETGDAVLWEPETLRVSGYAALDVPLDESTLKQRLSAMRASKLDAFRSLAEQLYGTVIYSESLVSETHLRSDSFRTMVDTVVRGAKVVDVRELKEGGYETVVELALDAEFRRCLDRLGQIRQSGHCQSPAASGLSLAEPEPAPVTRGYHIGKDRPRGE